MSSLFVLGAPSVGSNITIGTNDLVRSTKQEIRDSAVSGDLNNVSVLYSKSLPMDSASSPSMTQQALEANNLSTTLFSTATVSVPSSGY